VSGGEPEGVEEAGSEGAGEMSGGVSPGVAMVACYGALCGEKRV
jgi:hypothetical protein